MAAGGFMVIIKAPIPPASHLKKNFRKRWFRRGGTIGRREKLAEEEERKKERRVEKLWSNLNAKDTSERYLHAAE